VDTRQCGILLCLPIPLERDPVQGDQCHRTKGQPGRPLEFCDIAQRHPAHRKRLNETAELRGDQQAVNCKPRPFSQIRSESVQIPSAFWTIVSQLGEGHCHLIMSSSEWPQRRASCGEQVRIVAEKLATWQATRGERTYCMYLLCVFVERDEGWGTGWMSYIQSLVLARETFVPSWLAAVYRGTWCLSDHDVMSASSHAT